MKSEGLSKPIAFEGQAGRLSGEIVFPAGEGPFPALVMLHAAGWGESRFYRALAGCFAAAGVAALIFDRRGEGLSEGRRTMDLALLADDAAAAHAFLRRYAGIDPGTVGLWGYSNGAWVVGRAAPLVEALAFLILTGASAFSPAASEVFRRTQELRRHGIASETLNIVERAWTIAFAFLMTGHWDNTIEAEARSLAAHIEADTSLETLPTPAYARENPQLHPVPQLAPFLNADVRQENGASLLHMGYDPIPPLLSIRAPLLIVLAESDDNVPFSASLAAFEAVGLQREPFETRIQVIAGASHSFMTAAGQARHDGLPMRPPEPGDYLPGYLEEMRSWLGAHTT